VSLKTNLTLYVCWGALTFAAFFAIRFDVVYYRNTKIVCWGPTASFLTESKNVIVLGNYTLVTDYGPIYLDWFCDIEVIRKNVSGIRIGTGGKNTKNASHNLQLLGQDVEQNITVTFSSYGILDALSGEYNSFSLGDNAFTYSIIYFNISVYLPNDMLFSRITFDRIALKDDTEIVFSEENSYSLCLDVKENNWEIDVNTRSAQKKKFISL
jgi:hypothetical protein